MKGLVIGLATMLLAGAAGAQEGQTTLQINGKAVHVTSDAPPNVVGSYAYEKAKAPYFKLNADGTGSFEPHQRPGIPIRWWLLTNPDGSLVRNDGAGGTYQLTLVYQYGPGGDGNYPEGGYDQAYWTWLAAENCALILGERWKC